MELTPEQEKVLWDFAKKFIASQKDCPPECLAVLREDPEKFLLKGK